MSHQTSVVTIAILTGYLAEIYFASLRFIVQRLELLSNAKFKRWSCPPIGLFVLTESRKEQEER
jgi:hypothetical protein